MATRAQQQRRRVRALARQLTNGPSDEAAAADAFFVRLDDNTFQPTRHGVMPTGTLHGGTPSALLLFKTLEVSGGA